MTVHQPVATPVSGNLPQPWTPSGSPSGNVSAMYILTQDLYFEYSRVPSGVGKLYGGHPWPHIYPTADIQTYYMNAVGMSNFNDPVSGNGSGIPGGLQFNVQATQLACVGTAKVSVQKITAAWSSLSSMTPQTFEIQPYAISGFPGGSALMGTPSGFQLGPGGQVYSKTSYTLRRPWNSATDVEFFSSVDFANGWGAVPASASPAGWGRYVYNLGLRANCGHDYKSLMQDPLNFIFGMNFGWGFGGDLQGGVWLRTGGWKGVHAGCNCRDRNILLYGPYSCSQENGASGTAVWNWISDIGDMLGQFPNNSGPGFLAVPHPRNSDSLENEWYLDLDDVACLPDYQSQRHNYS